MSKIVFLPLSHKNFISSNNFCNLIKKKFYKKVNCTPFSDGGDDSDYIFNRKFFFNKKKIFALNYQLKKKKIFIFQKKNQLFIYGKSILGGRQKKINTLNYSSYGLGEVIKKNLNKKIFISLGGSINTDAGLGLMQALNVKFNLKDNSKRKKFLVGSDLKNIKKLSLDKKLKKKYSKTKIFLISDSNVYPTGKKGQCFVFGKQKNMKKKEIVSHDKSILKFCNLLYKKRHSFNKPYLGAGGAIGVSLNYLFPTKVICGSSFFFNSLKLNKIINSKTKILISTEGRFDNTSFLGKGFDFLKKYCEKKKNKIFFYSRKKFNQF